jgi:hypothetical protein
LSWSLASEITRLQRRLTDAAADADIQRGINAALHEQTADVRRMAMRHADLMQMRVEQVHGLRVYHPMTSRELVAPGFSRAKVRAPSKPLVRTLSRSGWSSSPSVVCQAR